MPYYSKGSKGNQKILFAAVDKLIQRKPTKLLPFSESHEKLANNQGLSEQTKIARSLPIQKMND